MDPLDPAWAHCDSIKGLRSTMTCRYCHKKVGGGGITDFKYHLSGLQGHGSACESVPEKVKNQMVRLIKNGPAVSRKKTKKRKKRSYVTMAFLKAHVKSKKMKEDIGSTKRSEVRNNYSSPEAGPAKSKKMKAHVKSKKMKEDKGSTKRSEVRNNYSSPEAGPAMNFQRRITRSSRDKKLDTNMFESLLEDLWKEVSEEKRRYFIYFDSLWFCSYQDELRTKDELRKNKILKWIKNKRVFSKKYVFVPVVCWGHWNLLILCHLGDMNRSPCMLLLDSLLDAGPKRLENDIRRFVSDIYKISGRKQDESFIADIPFLVPKVPQQINGEECGTYVLYFIFRFLESCPDTISLDGYPYFLTEEWFNREEFEKFTRKLEPSSLEKKRKGKEHQQSSDNADPPEEVHTFELLKNSSDSMESQVSSVPSINSAEPKAPQTETRHYIKRRKKAGTAGNFSDDKGGGKTKDDEDSNSERQNESQGGEMSNENSDNPFRCNSNRNKRTDGVGPTSYDEKHGDPVVGKDKTVIPGKQNSSSSVECLTESQDTSPRLASVIEEQNRLLLSQNSEPDPNISPFLKNSPIWQHIQTLEVFKQIPQRPHFRKLESYCQDVREGMAIGLMVTYSNVATSVDKLSFDDDVAVFEQKISLLDTLEENGFNVGQLRARMKRLLQIKTLHTGNHLKRAELETQLAQKEGANATVLLELDKVGLELTDLRKKVNILIEQRAKLAAEGDRLLNLTAGMESDIPVLRDEISNARRLRDSARENFEKLLAEPL